MRRFAAVVFVLLLPGVWSAGAAIHHVAPDGSGDFPTIQAAIDAAVDGDTILLSDGVFTGEGNRDLDLAAKAITLASQSDQAAACILDCGGSEAEPHRAVWCDDRIDEGTVIRDLTLRGGWEPDDGGAIFLEGAHPSIIGCIFTENWATDGGAIACRGTASPQITGCTFVANTADNGGALHLSEYASPQITGCDFEQNVVNFQAGAVYCEDDVTPLLDNCLFRGNTTPYRAGGLLTDGGAGPIVLTGCTFTANQATIGAAAFTCGTSTAEYYNCSFIGNDASMNGAGLYTACHGTAILERTLVAWSVSGQGVFEESLSEITLVCCDIYGNAGGDWIERIADQLGVNGNIEADPLLCNLGAGDFTLHHDSPCLPGRHPDGVDCGLIGAWPVGCPSVGVPVPERSDLIRCAPNPFAKETTFTALVEPSEGAEIGWTILDATGRRVRTLSSRGGLAARWDGADDAGHPVPAGIYFCRLRAGDRSWMRHLTLIR